MESWFWPSPIVYTHSFPLLLLFLSLGFWWVNAHKYHTKFMVRNNKMDGERSVLDSTKEHRRYCCWSCRCVFRLYHFKAFSTTERERKKNVMASAKAYIPGRMLWIFMARTDTRHTHTPSTDDNGLMVSDTFSCHWILLFVFEMIGIDGQQSKLDPMCCGACCTIFCSPLN